MDTLAPRGRESKFDPHEEFRASLSMLWEVFLRVLLKAHEFILLVENGRSMICATLFDEVISVSELPHDLCDVPIERQLIKLTYTHYIRIDLSHVLAEKFTSIFPLEVLA